MTAGLEVRALAVGEEAVWCAWPGAQRRQELAELRQLAKHGRFEAGDAWWVREEGRLLGRALLLREDAGRELVRLDLPWDGAWRSLARRLLAAIAAGVDADGVETLAWSPVEDEGPGAAELEPLAVEAGFAVLAAQESIELTALPAPAKSGEPPEWEAPTDDGEGLRLGCAWPDARLRLRLDNEGGAEVELVGGAEGLDWTTRWREVFSRLRRLGVIRLEWPDAAPGVAREALLELARLAGAPARVRRRRRWSRPRHGAPATASLS